MAVARTTAASRALGRTILRRTTSHPRPQAWRQIGRRNYATGHEKKTSDLPWVIGSTAFTVPAAVWLYAQGPEKGGAHHAEGAHDEEDTAEKDEGESTEEADEAKSDDNEEESTEDKKPQKEGEDDSGSDESKDDSSEESSDKDSSENESSKKEASNEGKQDDGPSKKDKGSTERKMSDDGYELPGPDAPGQINYKPSSGKGPGEGQKGARKPSETKGEKDSARNSSGAKNPNLDDPDWYAERSKKGQGFADTMKIHGTVDSTLPGRND